MPYSTEHKQQTRARIVECARVLFNRKGFTEVSIDEIMASAKLTRGGFYNHFRTKEELFVEAVAAYQDFNPIDRWPQLDFDPERCGVAFARQMVDVYLSREHLDDIEGHCPMIALPSDVARASPGVKHAYRELLERMAGMLAQSADVSAGTQEARRHGLALAALCVGGMVLARTIEDDAFREEIRAAARITAHELID
ncbi:TetR/AcrR family transcriptional regulator [Rhodanobacter sp. DHG33]|uniref:TetR/AcrR family transcriptional regulator n=1 Tax=Rhodanobacter sp. DHG33 TaxID=2775921 RepID=UPI00178448C5|nr:TetR/AcrR family transcriptional regulator [Rhodanobacter sp. DHG33]MBD8899919.1 TetR/AcrR family transcriptional regulator [Rhodanobacter sp. DHG33]